MGLFNLKKKKALDPSKPLSKQAFRLVEGAGPFKAGETCSVFLFRDRLELSAFDMTKSVALRYGQVKSVVHLRDVVQNDGDAISRGVAGALLFGGVGAIVGALSAGGSKRKNVLVVEYVSSSGDGSQLVFVEDDPQGVSCSTTESMLRTLCDLGKPTEPESNGYL